MIFDVLLFLYLLILSPKLLLDRLLKGKRHPGFCQRLGLRIPKVATAVGRPFIWIHAVSVGEVKAAGPLFRDLKLKEQNAFFLITTTTATGQAEAKRSLMEADVFGYLPLDFRWVVNRWVKKLNPSHFILVESDFWPHLLSSLKKNGTKISLVSGKMSKKSARRFHIVFPWAKKLFDLFDHLCVQNEEHFQRFFPFVTLKSRLQTTGNLKLDLKPQPIVQKLDLSQQPVITISCTHAPEEELLLKALMGGNWYVILAPRHPERFERIAQWLKKEKILYSQWSKNTRDQGQILLLDVMGQLPLCYAHSRLAILGGSFIDEIGGHNVLEPCLYGIPVFFGPYMQGQMELAKGALQFGAGSQVSLKEIRRSVEEFFANPQIEQAMKEGAKEFVAAGKGVTHHTLQFITN